MFNVPWYSWFNVLALPLLWGMLYVDMAVLGRPAWMKKLLSFHIAASIVCIFIYWNPQLAETLVPLSYLLALLIVPFAAWNIAQGIAALLQAVFQYLAHRFDREDKPVAAYFPAVDLPADKIDIHQDDLDLDEGVSCRTMEKEANELGQALASMFSGQSSAREKMDSVMTLLGDDEDDPATDLWTGIVAVGVYLATNLPPMYMSIQLLV